MIAFIIFSIGFVVCYTVYFFVSRYAYTYSEYKYTWIRREWRLLEGLLQDLEEVSRSLKQVMKKAKKHKVSPELKQVTQVLNDKEKRWKEEAEKLVVQASQYVRIFDELRKKRNSPMWFLWIIIETLPMIYTAFRMRQIKKSIMEHLGVSSTGDNNDTTTATAMATGKKICIGDIYGSLEKSRAKVRSLDRSIVYENNKHGSSNSGPPPIGNATDELTVSVKNLIDAHPDLKDGKEEQIKLIIMHLELLLSFVKDLLSLKLESNLENSWVTEACKTICEAKDAVDNIHRKANRKRWITDPRQLTERGMLRDDLLRVGKRISGLLDIKERYGFKFVRQGSSKPADHRRFQYQTTDDTELSSTVNNIHEWLIQLPKTSKKLADIVGLLSNMHRHLKETKATGYASAFRNTCLAKLKETALNIECYLKLVMEDSESQLPSELTGNTGFVRSLDRCIKVYSIEVRTDSCSVVGLEEDISQLVSQLTDNGEHGSTISIVGMEGIGKTTLAMKVYYHDSIESHFDVQCWVTIPQEADEEALVKFTSKRRVLRIEEKWIGKDEWIREVIDFLKDKLYLLVLDNVSSVDKWNRLQAAFAEIKEGSKIVVTTRDKDVASMVAQKDKPHLLRLRTKEQSWELFNGMAPYYPNQLEADAKKAVGRCGGLPCAIIHLGILLSQPGKKVTPEEFSELVKCIDRKYHTLWSNTMELNMRELKSSSKTDLINCFSYFPLFNRDFEIPVRRIVSSWIAQDLVQTRADDQTLEDTAYGYLLELIDRNMIQLVQRKPNGNVKTCRLPTQVQAPLLQVQGDSSGTRSTSSSLFPTIKLEGLLFFNFGDNEASETRDIDTNDPTVMDQRSSNPQSLIFFDTREGNKPGEEIGEYLCSGIAGVSFRKLQGLDLERVFRPQLPKNIGKLKKLAYLGLRGTYLEMIPESVGDLVCLQTLDLKHTYVRTLPCSIWKLKKLRRLYLNQSCQLPQQPSGISMRNFEWPRQTGVSMKNLQILSGVFVDTGSPLKDVLSKLTNLRKLVLAFQLEEQSVLATWIDKMNHLESLELRSTNEKREPQPLKLKRIPHLQKLSSLYLFGTLKKSIMDELPPCLALTHLTLSASGIVDDPMLKLGKLPKLVSLSFYSGSYIGEDMTCSSTSFPELLVLKLWKLDSLKKLEVEGGAMQKLRELEIRSCKELTITIELAHLKTLQKFEVS